MLFKGSFCDIVDLKSSLNGGLEKGSSAGDSKHFSSLFTQTSSVVLLDIKQKCSPAVYPRTNVLDSLLISLKALPTEDSQYLTQQTFFVNLKLAQLFFYYFLVC